MPRTPPEITPEPPATDDGVTQALTDHVTDLAVRYNHVKREKTESGMTLAARLRAQLRGLSHDHIHPNEDLIELDVPPAVAGESFKINEIEYAGHVTVPACVAQVLLHMIDKNSRVDQDRMRESGRTMNLGDLNARARAIGRDD